MSDTQVLFTFAAGAAEARPLAAGAAEARPLAAVERNALPPRRRGLAPVAAVRPEGDEDDDEPSGAAARQPRGRAAHCRIALQYLD
ncbi:hypothetical protein ACWDRR_03725 [Kitasatospora sp. NPDC003701]